MTTRQALPPEGFRHLLGGLRYCQEAAIGVAKDTIIAEIQAYGDARAKAARMEALAEAERACKVIADEWHCGAYSDAAMNCADALSALGGKGAA